MREGEKPILLFMTTVINIHVCRVTNGWWRGGGNPHTLKHDDDLPSTIESSTEEEHGLRATVAAATITALGYGLCCATGLRTRVGLSPFIMRRGERRKSVMLASVNCDNHFAA